MFFTISLAKSLIVSWRYSLALERSISHSFSMKVISSNTRISLASATILLIMFCSFFGFSSWVGMRMLADGFF